MTKGVKTIVIDPVPGTALAESKDAAKQVRQSVILPALAAGQKIRLDFANIDFATQSFIHALISDAIRRYGEGTFDLLEFKNCTDEVKEIVMTVFEYTMDAADAAQGVGER